jgi:hypothetical protein
MGCHTWFYKRLTKDEINRAKIHAISEAESYEIEGFVDYSKFITNSIETCDYKWLVAGYGFQKGIVIQYKNIFYLTVCDFHDIFRLRNYPRKKLLNYKQLKKWMGKRWYDLNEDQKHQLCKFWKKYPNGLIAFG